jgi:NitT/TauT family transport system substrate-binding protein
MTLNMSRKSIFLVVALGLCMIGCNQAKPRERVKLQLDWSPGSEHAFVYFAKSKQIFADEGIDLEIVPGSGSVDSANMTSARAVDFALCSGETVTQARSAAEPRLIKALAVFYPNTPTAIFSLQARNITKPQDLYGKKLGVIKGSSAYKNYLAFVRVAGLDRSSIDEVPVTGDLREMLPPAAQIDALVQFSFQQPLRLRLLGHSVNEIKLADFGLKIYGQALITNTDNLERRPDLVRRFTRAVQAAYIETIRNPEEALRVFLKQFPEQDVAYSRAKLNWVNDFVRSGVPAGKPIGYHDDSGWLATKKYLADQGALERDLPVQDFAVYGFLDSAKVLNK